LVAFQIRGIKQTFTMIAISFSILSLLSLSTHQLKGILDFIGINVISGIFTLLMYLIGANISRFIQFGMMSPKIIIYFFILFLLLHIATK
jgi:hypothetical protein